jgi:hypothetical protein
VERQVTLEQVTDASTQSLKNALYHRWPGAVVAYHADSQTADIQPMTNDPRTDTDTGAVVPEPWPVLLNVPIAWPRFGGFVLVGPLKVGDPVTLEAFDIDPTSAFAAGAKKSTSPVNPTDVRRHSGGYWSATPTNLTGPIADASEAAAKWLLGLDGDTAQILFALAALVVGKTGSTVSIAGGQFALVVAPWAMQLATALTTFSGTIGALTPNPPTTPAQALAYLGTIITAATTLNSALGTLPPPATTATTAT